MHDFFLGKFSNSKENSIWVKRILYLNKMYPQSTVIKDDLANCLNAI